MAKNKKVEVVGRDVTFFHQGTEDYISLTDLARHKNAEHTGVVVSHWLSTRYSIEFMGMASSPLAREAACSLRSFSLRLAKALNDAGLQVGYCLKMGGSLMPTNAAGYIKSPDSSAG